MTLASGRIRHHDLSLRGPASRTGQAPQLAHELDQALTGEGLSGALLEALDAREDWLVVRQLRWAVPWPAGVAGDEALRRALPELGRALARAEEQGGVLRFPSRVAYLTTCLNDLLAGHHDRWYHRAVLGDGPAGEHPLANLLREAGDDRDALLGQALRDGRLGATLAALPTTVTWELLAQRLDGSIPPRFLRRLRRELQGDHAMTTSRTPVDDRPVDEPATGHHGAPTGDPLAELQASLHAGVDELGRALDAAVDELSGLGRELARDLGQAVRAEELAELRDLWEQAVAADPPGPEASGGVTTVLGELLARATEEARERAAGDSGPAPADLPDATPPGEQGLLDLLRGLLPEVPLDERARAALQDAWQAWLRSEGAGPAWSDPRALTLAVGRGLVRTVEALEQAGVETASSWRRPEQLDELARRHDWLDGEALRAGAGQPAAAGPVAADTGPADAPSPGRARLTALLDELLAAPDLQRQLRVEGSARRAVVLHTALRERAPELARQASDGPLLLDALARWEERQERAERIARQASPSPPASDPAPSRPPAVALGPDPSPADRPLHTAAAGLLLMLRTTRDLRLGPLLADGLDEAAARQLLLHLGAGLAGLTLPTGPEAPLDPALLLWSHAGASLEPLPDAAELPRVPRTTARALVRRLARRRRDLRLDGDEPLQVVGLRGGGRRWALALDHGSGSAVLLAAARDRATLARQLRDWCDRADELGRAPPVLRLDPTLARELDLPDLGSDDLAPAHLGEQATSLLDLLAPAGPPAGTQEVLAAVGAACLRAWARWLPGFEGSSAGFLAERFLRRPARLAWDRDDLVVHLQPAPLDVVLRRARAFEPLEGRPGDPIRRLRFEGAGG